MSSVARFDTWQAADGTNVARFSGGELQVWDGAAWVAPSTEPLFTVEYLVVAGGGGGGYSVGGGGGAGGYRTGTIDADAQLTATITVGAGGSAGTGGSADGGTGNNSVFDTITSLGGGSGATGGGFGGDGGSGGGSGGGGQVGGDPIGTFDEGTNGGLSGLVSGRWIASGGGGASVEGSDFNPSVPGYGGIGGRGFASLLGNDRDFFSGQGRGGGGGGGVDNRSGAGAGTGTDGGGNGGSGGAGQSGTVNTGGGGGGGGYNGTSFNGGAGGSGIVIFKVPGGLSVSFSAGVTQTSQTINGFDHYTVTATSTTSETVTIG